MQMALSREAPKPNCLFHSDQGIEYATHEYRDLLESTGIRRSMSRRGTPLDNAKMELFFHTLKAELVHKRLFENEIEAVAHIVEYIKFLQQRALTLFIELPITGKVWKAVRLEKRPQKWY